MHEYTRYQTACFVISPCQQDTDQKSRKDLGGIYMKDTEQKCGNQNCFSRIVLLEQSFGDCSPEQ